MGKMNDLFDERFNKMSIDNQLLVLVSPLILLGVVILVFALT